MKLKLDSTVENSASLRPSATRISDDSRLSMSVLVYAANEKQIRFGLGRFDLAPILPLAVVIAVAMKQRIKNRGSHS